MPWTYGQTSSSLASTSGISQHVNSLSPYSSGMNPAVSYAGSAHPSRIPSISGPSMTPYVTGPARQGSTPIYGGSFNDELCDPFYSMQSMQYPGSLHEHQGLTTSYTAQETGRQWTPISPGSRSSYNGSNLDPESLLRYGHLNTSPVNMTSVAAVTTEGNSLFPAMTALVGSLPPSSGDRTLPNPNTKRASAVSNGSLSQGSLVETNPTGLPSNLNYKSTASWASIDSVASGSQASSSSIAASATLPINSKASLSPRSSQDTPSYGYIPLSRSPPSSLTTARSPEYDSSTGLPNSSTSMESQMSLTDTTFHAGFSSEDILPSHHSSSSLYNYSIGIGTKTGSLSDPMASEGLLSNGQNYTRLRQPQPQHAASFDPLRTDSLDTASHVPQRTSVSSGARHY